MILWFQSLLLLAVTACWGWTFVLVKDVITGPQACPVMPFLFWRFLIATAVLAPLVWRGIPRRTGRAGVGLGLALAAGYALQTLGLRWTTPTNSALVTGLFAVFAALASRGLYGEPVPGPLRIALGLGVVGLGLLTGSAPTRVQIGDALTVVAAASYGLHIATLSQIAPHHDLSALTFVQMLTVTGVTGALSVFGPAALWPPRSAWPAIGITAVFASAFAFLVQSYVQQRLTAVRAAVILSTEPLFGALFGHWLAGDRLRGLQWVGAIMILSAVVLGEIWPAWARRIFRR